MSTLFVDTINEKTTNNGVYIPGHVLQVKETKSTTRTTTSSTSYVDFLTVSITPSSTSSKILIDARLYVGTNWWNNRSKFAIARDSTIITGNSGDLWPWQYGADSGNSVYEFMLNTVILLDSPATTSAITYKAQLANQNSGTTLAMNGNYQTSGSSYGQSTIIVMEIGG